MNSNYDKELETEIGRALKNLPELQAPDSLLPGVLNLLEQRRRTPVAPRSWQMWPASLQSAALLILFILFAGICWAGWKFSETDAVVLAMHRLQACFSALSALGTTLNALVGSGILAFKKLGPGFMAAALLTFTLIYFICLGLGTIYLRTALFASAPLKRP